MVRRDAIAVDVLLNRQQRDQPWRTDRWHPIAVEMIDPMAAAEDARTGANQKRSSVPLMTIRCRSHLPLLASELAAYRVNIENGDPAVYVVFSERGGSGDAGVAIDRLSASPFAVAHIGSGTTDELVCERLTMPQPIIAVVRDFIRSAASGYGIMTGGQAADAAASLDMSELSGLNRQRA